MISELSVWQESDKQSKTKETSYKNFVLQMTDEELPFSKIFQMEPLEFSLNGAELSLNSLNSENLRNHWGMNWVQYKDLLCCLYLCGWVVEPLSLTQEILDSNPAIFLFDFNFFVTEFSDSVNSVKAFRENSNESSSR